MGRINVTSPIFAEPEGSNNSTAAAHLNCHSGTRNQHMLRALRPVCTSRMHLGIPSRPFGYDQVQYLFLSVWQLICLQLETCLSQRFFVGEPSS